MRTIRLAWLVAALLTLVAACAPVNIRYLGNQERIQVTALLRQPFAVQAGAKQSGDVTRFVFQLFNVTASTVAATYQTVSPTFTWGSVPDGTYQLRAEAFGMGGVSITQGGMQTSSNNAVVTSPTVTYSTGASLTVTLPLLGGTGETALSSINVANGNPPPALAAGLLSPATVAGTFPVGGVPMGITIDGAGNIWVANTSNYLSKLSSTGVLLATVACPGSPYDIEADSSGNVWVTLQTGAAIQKFSSVGVSLGSLAVSNSPQGITADANGNFWVAESGGNSIRKVSPGLSSLLSVSLPTGLPRKVKFDRWGNALAVCAGTGNIEKVDPASGSVLSTITVGGTPQAAAVDSMDSIWVTDVGGAQVKRFSASGTLMGTFSVGNNPFGLVIDQSGRIWVANGAGNSVTVLAANGVALSTVAVGTSPRLLALAADGSVWVTNKDSGSIMKLVI